MQDTKLIKKTLIHYGTTQCKLPNRPRGLFYPLALLRLVYLLYELPNKPDGLPPSGTFTAYSTSYQTGQTDFHPLALLRLALQATEQARRASSGTFTACSIVKHWMGQTDFHPLIVDGSTICNQLGLGDDQGLGQRLIYTPHSFDLQVSYRLLFQGDREARSRRYDDKVVATMRRYKEELIAVARKMTCNPWSAGPVIMTLYLHLPLQNTTTNPF